jgi:hypothetical protein
MVHLEASAELVYAASREFYESVSSSHDAVRENLAQQLQDGDSELGESIIITLGESFGGISVYYPSEETKTRRLVSLRHLVNVSNPRPNMLELLRSFKTIVEPIPMPRYMYWVQLGVTSDFRRLGVASMLASAMEHDSKSRRFEYICCHVSRENTASLRMQLGRGYARISQDEYQFIALAKKLA